MSRYLLPGLTCCLGLTLSMAASAQDSPSPRRTLASCMMKRMTADRGVSYNEAQRMCRDDKGSDNKPQTAANTQKKAVS